MANTKGNKPKSNVEAGLYVGRKGFGGEDGLGQCDPSGLATPDKTAAHGPKYDNEVKSGWRRGDDVGGRIGSGPAGVQDRPGFDRSSPRKPPPSTGGGGDTTKSPFSAAGRKHQ